jgi:hypothetical protein
VEEVGIDASGVEISEIAERAEWGSFRGPNNDGIVNVAAPTQWSDTGNIQWSSEVPGRGHASPIVVGNLVVLPTAIDAKQQQMVLAYDRSTGAGVWEKLIHQGGFPSSGEIHPKGTNANSTLASDGKRLFCVFLNSGKVFATGLDLDGEQIWQTELGAFSSKFGYAPSPIIYKSLVILAADNAGGGYIAALDGATGKIAWRIARDAKSSYSTPAVFSLDGATDRLFISGCDSLTSYDPETGDEQWSTPCTAEATCGTVVSTQGLVFASGGYPDRQTVCLDSSGEIQWSNRVKIYEPSMLAYEDAVYAVTDEGIAYCWDAKTGKQHWRERLGGNFSSSPWVANGLVYVSDLSGKTHIFRASTNSMETIATCRLGSDCYSTPAVVEGKIYIRVGYSNAGKRQEKLVCIGAKAEL